MTDQNYMPDTHDSPPSGSSQSQDSHGGSEWRIKLAFLAMLLCGIVLPVLASCLSGSGDIAAMVIPSLLFFPLICIIWPSWETPLWALLIVYSLDFLVGGMMGGTVSLVGSLATRYRPELLAIPLSAAVAGWLAAIAARLYVRHRSRITGQ